MNTCCVTSHVIRIATVYSILAFTVVLALLSAEPVTAERIPNRSWKCPNGLSFDSCGHNGCGEKWLCTSNVPSESPAYSSSASPLNQLSDDKGVKTNAKRNATSDNINESEKGTASYSSPFSSVEGQSVESQSSWQSGGGDRQNHRLNQSVSNYDSGPMCMYPEPTSNEIGPESGWVIGKPDPELKVTRDLPEFGDGPRASQAEIKPGESGYTTTVIPFQGVDENANGSVTAYYVNGICTPYDEAVSGAQLVSNATGLEVKQVYSRSAFEDLNETKECLEPGALTESVIDVAEALRIGLGGRTEAQEQLAKSIVTDVMNGKEVRVFAHSRGAAETFNAINQAASTLNEAGYGNSLSSITVITAGGFSPGPEDWATGVNVIPLVNQDDIVTYFRGTYAPSTPGAIPGASSHGISEYSDLLPIFGGQQLDPYLKNKTIIGLEPRNSPEITNPLPVPVPAPTPTPSPAPKATQESNDLHSYETRNSIISDKDNFALLPVLKTTASSETGTTHSGIGDGENSQPGEAYLTANGGCTIDGDAIFTKEDATRLEELRSAMANDRDFQSLVSKSVQDQAAFEKLRNDPKWQEFTGLISRKELEDDRLHGTVTQWQKDAAWTEKTSKGDIVHHPAFEHRAYHNPLEHEDDAVKHQQEYWMQLMELYFRTTQQRQFR